MQVVAYEMPPGVRRNVQRSLATLGATAPATAPPAQLQLQILLRCFHAVLQVCTVFRLGASVPFTLCACW